MKSLNVAVALVVLAGTLFAGDFGKGSKSTVRLTTTVSSDGSTFGDPIDAVLVNDVVINGKVIASKGAAAHGIVSSANRSTGGRISAPGSVSIRLETLDGSDGTYHLSTSTYTREGRGHSPSPFPGGSTGGISIDTVGGVHPQSPVPVQDPNSVTLATGGPEAIIPAETVVTFKAVAISPAKK